ncbi:uncharacterized protein LOC101852164, partial [Aplysia californica]|uniref:Uncharacterized protein LOC101852164 n=1 Tax=Aplysia californica TaxID=6500 RepID=A0ABM0ZW48_APLCA
MLAGFLARFAVLIAGFCLVVARLLCPEPCSCRHAPSDVTVNCSYRRLTSLPDFSVLEEGNLPLDIFLNGNKLSQLLATSFWHVALRLRTLEISKNEKILEISPRAFARSRGVLKVVKLDPIQNDLAEDLRTFAEASVLEELRIETSSVVAKALLHSPLTDTPGDAPLKVLHIRNSGVTSLEATAVRGLSLTELGLSDNHLSDFPTSLRGLMSETLQVLYLDGNRIQSLEQRHFPKGCKLQTLHLQGNSISAVQPGTLDRCPDLEDLNLAGNKHIVSLDSGLFVNVRNLKLDVSGTDISDLSFVKSHQVHRLTAFDTKVLCECNTRGKQLQHFGVKLEGTCSTLEAGSALDLKQLSQYCPAFIDPEYPTVLEGQGLKDRGLSRSLEFLWEFFQDDLRPTKAREFGHDSFEEVRKDPSQSVYQKIQSRSHEKSLEEDTPETSVSVTSQNAGLPDEQQRVRESTEKRLAENLRHIEEKQQNVPLSGEANPRKQDSPKVQHRATGDDTASHARDRLRDTHLAEPARSSLPQSSADKKRVRRENMARNSNGQGKLKWRQSSRVSMFGSCLETCEEICSHNFPDVRVEGQAPRKSKSKLQSEPKPEPSSTPSVGLFIDTQADNMADRQSQGHREASQQGHVMSRLAQGENSSSHAQTVNKTSTVGHTLETKGTPVETVSLNRPLTHPDRPVTHPDRQATHPDRQISHPDRQTTHPDRQTTHPD